MRKMVSLCALTLLASALAVASGGRAAPAQVTIPAAPSNLTAAGVSTSAIRIDWTDNLTDE